MTYSYSSRLKEYLLEIEDKKDCCKQAFNAGLDMKEYDSSCPKDAGCYLRGLFVSFGTMSDPKKQYLVSFNEKAVDVAEDILISCGIFPLRATRKGKPLLYIRENESISDFLAVIGATNYALDIMKISVLKSIKKDVNRKSNAEIANIDKTATAFAEFAEAVRILKDRKQFNTLPEELRITVQIRLDNPELSLSQLCKLHEPPISRSGLNHRLNRIIEEAKKHKEKKV